MDKKSLLTSMIALGFAVPAFAEPFPADKLMGENKVYENAAIYDNMGVYEGIVYANAVYTDAAYNVLPGTYLPMDSNVVANCLSGYYCPGLAEPANFSSSSNQGLTTCPTGYSGSDEGASSISECYKACDVPHSTGVTGHDYYGFGVDTCAPTGCVLGWHMQEDAGNNYAFNQFRNNIGIGSGLTSAYISSAGGFNNGRNYYGIDSSVNYGVNSGVDSGAATGYNNPFDEGPWSDVETPEWYDMTDRVPGMWGVGFGLNKGFVRGMARLSSVGGDVATSSTPPTMKTTAELGVEGGNNCWCNITGYRLWNYPDVTPWVPTSSSWAFASNMPAGLGINDCSRRCISLVSLVDITGSLGDGTFLPSDFRSSLFNSVSVLGARYCAANTITIHWNGASQLSIDHTNAGTAQYGGDIRTPRQATEVSGKIFQGWVFSRTAPSE